MMLLLEARSKDEPSIMLIAEGAIELFLNNIFKVVVMLEIGKSSDGRRLVCVHLNKK